MTSAARTAGSFPIEFMTPMVYNTIEKKGCFVINKIIGENIRVLRDNVGLTQSNLSQFMRVDQSLISKVEK